MHVVVYGAVEYLDEDDRVITRVSATTLEDKARRYFAEMLAA